MKISYVIQIKLTFCCIHYLVSDSPILSTISIGTRDILLLHTKKSIFDSRSTGCGTTKSHKNFQETTPIATCSTQLHVVVYYRVFGATACDTDLGCTDVTQLCIYTGEATPVRQPPRCVPAAALCQQTQELLHGMQKQGHLQREVGIGASESAAASVN